MKSDGLLNKTEDSCARVQMSLKLGLLGGEGFEERALQREMCVRA